MPFSLNSLETVASLMTRPVGDGKTRLESPVNSRARSNTAIASGDSGMRCWRVDFMREAGTVHVAESKSISGQRAPRTSPLLVAVSARNLTTNFVVSAAPEASIVPNAA